MKRLICLLVFGGHDWALRAFSRDTGREVYRCRRCPTLRVVDPE